MAIVALAVCCVLPAVSQPKLTTTAAQLTFDGEFLLPTRDGKPYGIVAASNGDVWFTEIKAGNIGRLPRGGVIIEYPLPNPKSAPANIVEGPDHALWFTEVAADKIGRITDSGTISEYALPSGSAPYAIAFTRSGDLWFSEKGAIGRRSRNGTITSFPAPNINEPYEVGIAAGGDGNLWFTEGSAIGRMTPHGAIKEFRLRNGGSIPTKIVFSEKGSLWFTRDWIPCLTPLFEGKDVHCDVLDFAFGSMSLAGEAREDWTRQISSIAPASDGTVWVSAGSAVGFVHTDGSIDFNDFKDAQGHQLLPLIRYLAAGKGRTLWFTGEAPLIGKFIY